MLLIIGLYLMGELNFKMKVLTTSLLFFIVLSLVSNAFGFSVSSWQEPEGKVIDKKWRVEVATTGADEVVQLPLKGTVSYIVDWGDGNTEYVNTTGASHTYDLPGTYDIVVIGTATSMSTGSYPAFKTKIKKIKNMGHTKIDDAYYLCYQCSELDEVDLGDTDMDAINMGSAFNAVNGGEELISFDLGNASFKSVLGMSNFLNSSKIKTSDVDKVMRKIISDKETLPAITIDFGTSSFSDLNARLILQGAGIVFEDEGYDLSLIPADEQKMIFIIELTDTMGVLDFQIPTIGTNDYVVNWGDGTTQHVVGTGPTFAQTHTYPDFGYYKVTIEGTCTAFSYDQHNIDNSEYMLREIWNLGVMGWTNLQGAFRDCRYMERVRIGNTDTSLCTDMSFMFWFCGVSTLSTFFDFDWAGLDTANVTDLSYFSGHAIMDVTGFDLTSNPYMFSAFSTGDITGGGTLDLNGVTDIGAMFLESTLQDTDFTGWDVSTITNIDQLFNNAQAAGAATIDCSGWNLIALDHMQYVFSGAYAGTIDITGWNTPILTTLKWYVFSADANVTWVGIGDVDVDLVTDMDYAFRNFGGTTLDLSTWTTDSLASMYALFQDAANLTSINLTGWNTTGVDDLSFMFSGCLKLLSINLTPLDVSNVLRLYSTFRYVGSDTSSSVTINTTGWDTGLVQELDYTFADSNVSATLDLSHWDTVSVETMYSTFRYADRLTSVNVTGWDTTNVTTMIQMFANLGTISVDISGFEVDSLSSAAGMFSSSIWNTAQYDAALVAFAGQTVNSGVSFSANTTKYTETTAHATLADAPNNWVFTDGGAL